MKNVTVVHPNPRSTDDADFYNQHLCRQIEDALDGLSQKTGRVVSAEVERLRGLPLPPDILLKVVVQHRVNDIHMHLFVNASEISNELLREQWTDDAARQFFLLAELP